jgi:hypothetical protein
MPLTRYTSVEVNPPSPPDRIDWSAGGDGGTAGLRPPGLVDLFARQSVGVCALYSRLLRSATPVPARIRSLGIDVYDPDVTPAAWLDADRLAAGPIAPIDASVPKLPPARRPEAYLRWLQPVLLEHARSAGVPATGFAEAFEASLAVGGLLRWDGAGRGSPDRRYRATPRYWFDADGGAWVRVVVTDRRGDPVTESRAWECFPLPAYWRRSAMTLRWTYPATVMLETWWPADAKDLDVPAERRHPVLRAG